MPTFYFLHYFYMSLAAKGHKLWELTFVISCVVAGRNRECQRRYHHEWEVWDQIFLQLSWGEFTETVIQQQFLTRGKKLIIVMQVNMIFSILQFC